MLYPMTMTLTNHLSTPAPPPLPHPLNPLQPRTLPAHHRLRSRPPAPHPIRIRLHPRLPDNPIPKIPLPVYTPYLHHQQSNIPIPPHLPPQNPTHDPLTIPRQSNHNPHHHFEQHAIQHLQQPFACYIPFIYGNACGCGLGSR